MEEDEKDKRIHELEAELAVFRAGLEEACRWVRWDTTSRAKEAVERWTRLITSVDSAATILQEYADTYHRLPETLAEHFIMHISNNRDRNMDRVHCSCLVQLPERNSVNEAVGEWVKHFLDSL